MSHKDGGKARDDKMSHVCVDMTRCPSGRLIVIGFLATVLVITSALSIINMDVAPVSAIACVDAMVRACNCLADGLPNSIRAVAAMDGAHIRRGGIDVEDDVRVQFDVMTVTSSSSVICSK